MYNPILKVHWAGWESNTLRLQKAGWQCSVEEDPMYRSIRIAIKHPAFKMYGISNSIQYDRKLVFESYIKHITIPIHYMASEMRIQIMSDLSAFRPIDAEPQFIETEMKSIKDYKMFRPLENIPEIIVEPPTVSELLDKIIEYQSPKMVELRKRMLQEKRKEELGLKQIHAQIISLAA